MNLGTLVKHEGHVWRVYKVDKHVKTVTLIRWGGALLEIADDDPGASVVADPSEWPVVTVRVRPNAGPLVTLSLTRGRRLRQLEPFVDWVPSDMGRPGGSIFVSPALNLRIGEVLIAEYKTGASARIVITKRFGTMAERKQQALGVPEKRGLMEFLDGDDFVE
jgi:hypothetical protein